MTEQKDEDGGGMMPEERGDQAWRSQDISTRYFEPTYSGALSFLRRPYCDDPSQLDVMVTGIPFDGATTYRSGCRLGPRAIRAASVQLAELPPFPFGFEPFSRLKVGDGGDVVLNPHSPETIETAIIRHARAIISTGCKMLSFGGDHFVSYPLLKAHAETYGPVALIHFDAHSDTWDSFGSLDHGTMFLRACNEGIIDISHSIQLGLRTHNDRDLGFEMVTSPELHRRPIDDVIAQIHDRVGNRPCYVSFDIDVLDPAFAPGTGTPVSGGLATWQALELVRGLAGINMVGMDVVEVSPAYDHAEITALAAATVAHDWLCVLASAEAG